jgi:SAM-dependent methyltransferase
MRRLQQWLPLLWKAPSSDQIEAPSPLVAEEPPAAPVEELPVEEPTVLSVEARPERYRRSGDFLIFDAASDGDFDWLESEIARLGYYERAGPWGYGIDLDKTVLAAMIQSLGAAKFLELGCGDGSVLACANLLNIEGAGLDISAFARDRAQPEVQERIILGDLLTTPGLQPAELICAFDLIEHISPNKIEPFMRRLVELMPPGGLLLLNTPAFGDDRIYGLVHGYWIDEWKGDDKRSKLWRQFPCCDDGLPLMGHLIWADWQWWEGLFAANGLRRLDAVERSLHAKFDATMSYSEARRSYFLLGKDVNAQREADLCVLVDGFELERTLEALSVLLPQAPPEQDEVELIGESEMERPGGIEPPTFSLGS